MIYFLGIPHDESPIKIGYSDRPLNRRDFFQYWSPYKIELLAVIEGTRGDERTLHKIFWGQHSHNEWFHRSPEMMATIDALNRGEDIYDLFDMDGWRAKIIWPRKDRKPQGAINGVGYLDRDDDGAAA